MVEISKLVIGHLQINSPVLLAPMAGVTDRIFRELVYEQCPGLAYTEMISAMALIYTNRKTFKMLDLEPYRPLGVQIFGSDPEIMAKAAQIIVQSAPSLIDINMGCPTPKIVKNGDGAALMRTPDLAAQIVEAVAKAVDVPVTVKIRAGWDGNSVNAPEFAALMAQAGAKAITVHGRTRSQLYGGRADWEVISQVVESVNVPVIGNGDIFSVDEAVQRLEKSGCAGIMIGRGALGNPWLIGRARKVLAGEVCSPEPTREERIQMAIEHLRRSVAYLGEKVAVPQMRKHLSWYLKGIPGIAGVKNRIQRIESAKEVEGLLANLYKS